MRGASLRSRPPRGRGVATVEVFPSEAEVAGGETSQLAKALKSAKGQAITGSAAIWTRSGGAVATAGARGQVICAGSSDADPEERLSNQHAVPRWARIAAWPISIAAAGMLLLMLAGGLLFSLQGAAIASSILLAGATLFHVARHGVEPPWLRGTGPNETWPFHVVVLAQFIAFHGSLFRLSAAFFLLVALLYALLLFGIPYSAALPEAVDTAVPVVIIILLLTAPVWTASLAPGSSWIDRIVGMAGVVISASLLGTAVRWLRARRPA